MIISLLILGWTLVVVTVLCMCRTSALGDTAAPDLVPLPREEHAASPPPLRKAA